MKLRQLAHLRGSPLHWWFRNSTPTRWIRRFIYLLGVLLLLISGTAVVTVWSQTNEVNRVTQTIAPAIEANGQVLQAMTDADSGLRGYQISRDIRLLTAYHSAHARAIVALATLRKNLVLSKGHDAADEALDADLWEREALAVNEWWSYALRTEAAVTRGSRINILQGVAVFDDFRQINTSLSGDLKTELDQALDAARANSGNRIRQIIGATLLALLATFILGKQYTRTVSEPIAALRDTMNRQRGGDYNVRAHEDQGSSEIRSLAADFNALTEQKLLAERSVEDKKNKMAGLVDLSLTVGRELSLDELLTRIVESARKVVGARHAALGVLDATRTGFAKLVTAGLSPEEKALIGDLSITTGLLSSSIREPKVMRINHVAEDSRSVGLPLRHLPMDSFLAVPIFVRGEVYGNLYLTNKSEGSFTSEDEQRALAVAGQAAVMVDAVWRFNDERHRANMLEVEQEIEHATHEAAGIQHALDIMCSMLGQKLGVDRVKTDTHIDRKHDVILGSEWHRPDLPPLGPVPDFMSQNATRLAEDLWRTVGRRVMNDYLAPQVHTEGSQVFLRYTNARAAIIVPIILGDRAVGSIYVIMVDKPRHWTTSEVHVVDTIAGFVGRFIADAEYQVYRSEHIKRLERLEVQKTNFVATVSHELRTPLTSIIGYLEILQNEDTGELTDDQQQMLEVIDRNANRLRALIDNLLAINQSESQDFKDKVTEVSMCELITSTCQEFYPFAQSRAIELKIEAGPAAAIVNGNQEQLHSAISNVVSNAMKFSYQGGAVTIVCSIDERTRTVRFICQDFGIGIPSGDQSGLFTRFFRANNATEQQIPGSGLGLAIVKQIVDDHGGQIRLSSVEGEGTTVVIDLPLSSQTS